VLRVIFSLDVPARKFRPSTNQPFNKSTPQQIIISTNQQITPSTNQQIIQPSHPPSLTSAKIFPAMTIEQLKELKDKLAVLRRYL